MTKIMKHLRSQFKTLITKLLDFGAPPIFLALLFAFIVISMAIAGRQKQQNEATDLLSAQSQIYRVREGDHVLGNPKTARFVLINYSDTECPYCKKEFFDFQTLMKEHKDDVAIVYRHSAPQTGRFKNSFAEAKALECGALLRDEGAFWSYLELIYRTTGSHDALTYESLISLGEQIGISRADLEQCVADKKSIAAKVEWDTTASVLSGVQMVPSTVLLRANSRDAILLEGLAYKRIVALLLRTSSK